jgi:hypothetical protein
MTALTNPVLHEVLDCWPAWQMLTGYVMLPDADARTVDPCEVEQALAGLDSERRSRLLFLLVGYRHADSLREAADLLLELRRLAITGRRPRFAVEAGLSFGEFEGLRS